MKEDSNIENATPDRTSAIEKLVRRRRRPIIASKRNYDWYGKAQAKLRSNKLLRRHAMQASDIQKCFRCELPMRWHSEHLIDGSQGQKPVQVFECSNCGQLSAHAGKRALVTLNSGTKLPEQKS